MGMGQAGQRGAQNRLFLLARPQSSGGDQDSRDSTWGHMQCQEPQSGNQGVRGTKQERGGRKKLWSEGKGLRSNKPDKVALKRLRQV